MHTLAQHACGVCQCSHTHQHSVERVWSATAPTCRMALVCRAGPPMAHLEGSGPSCASSLKGLPGEGDQEQTMSVVSGV